MDYLIFCCLLNLQFFVTGAIPGERFRFMASQWNSLPPQEKEIYIARAALMEVDPTDEGQRIARMNYLWSQVKIVVSWYKFLIEQRQPNQCLRG